MAKFKTRARALDLLGRQQIAGIPTAINELFKNAHDAYADKVEVDYFRSLRLFVLRDDGLGMTLEDFESRWLTLGTESKFSNHKIPPLPKADLKPERPMMGEKGIGRLAIASIGKQVLILSRAFRDGKACDLVVAFINWEVFELPGLDLDQVVIPLRQISGNDTPGTALMSQMKEELANSIKALIDSNDVDEEEGNRIIGEVLSFGVVPSDLEKSLPGLSLSGGGIGTHFYISPTDDTLNQDIDGEPDSKDATKIQKMLVGFTNTMTPDHPQPQVEVAFRDYRNNDGTYFNLLDKEQFFTPEDFQLADHHFQGTFDEFGQFNGTVKVYNEKEFEHKINWNGNGFKQTDCGTFTINVSYFQGTLRQSTIDPINHARLIAKADKYGGLYIYRNNIRILPYGNSDYDFIDIERNRTKSAGYYFFSYRRMFGVLDISKDKNVNLKEKAGREGFIENKAYRQVREILKNFFVQLAADFFREGGGPKSEFWITRRTEQEKIHKARERRDQQAKVRKEKFQNTLNKFFDELSKNRFNDDVESFLEQTEKNLGSVAYVDDTDEASQKILDHEITARQELSKLIEGVKINQPRGFNISKETRLDYEAYLTEFEKLNINVFTPAEDRIGEIVNECTYRLKIEISKRKRLEQAVNFISEEAKKATSLKEKETREAAAAITQKVKDLTNELMTGMEDKIRGVKDQFKNLKIDDREDFDLVRERKRMEEEIIQEKNRSTEILESVIAQLEGIYWGSDDDGNVVTNQQMNAALEEELYELREKVHADVELSQLGLALGVIHHEFNSSINSIRSSIKELKAWADVDQHMEGVYNNIRTNFEHLDSYLSLFTPLNRRLYRKQENIAATDIKLFLLDLFKARLERHNIQLKSTKGFSEHFIYGYRSTFYPVFVNIVDNAIYWLKQKQDNDEKVIRLHADENGFYVSNNGPEIKANDSERIFDLGYTRKERGRGMGLHISKEVLEGVNYDIFLDNPRAGSTVTFKIAPKLQTSPAHE